MAFQPKEEHLTPLADNVRNTMCSPRRVVEWRARRPRQSTARLIFPMASPSAHAAVCEAVATASNKPHMLKRLPSARTSPASPSPREVLPLSLACQPFIYTHKYSTFYYALEWPLITTNQRALSASVVYHTTSTNETAALPPAVG